MTVLDAPEAQSTGVVTSLSVEKNTGFNLNRLCIVALSNCFITLSGRSKSSSMYNPDIRLGYIDPVNIPELTNGTQHLAVVKLSSDQSVVV